MNAVAKRILWGSVVHTEGVSMETSLKVWRVVRPLLILWAAVCVVAYAVLGVQWLLG